MVLSVADPLAFRARSGGLAVGRCGEGAAWPAGHLHAVVREPSSVLRIPVLSCSPDDRRSACSEAVGVG